MTDALLDSSIDGPNAIYIPPRPSGPLHTIVSRHLLEITSSVLPPLHSYSLRRRWYAQPEHLPRNPRNHP